VDFDFAAQSRMSAFAEATAPQALLAATSGALPKGK
jgi:hypothetical protein